MIKNEYIHFSDCLIIIKKLLVYLNWDPNNVYVLCLVNTFLKSLYYVPPLPCYFPPAVFYFCLFIIGILSSFRRIEKLIENTVSVHPLNPISTLVSPIINVCK